MHSIYILTHTHTTCARSTIFLPFSLNFIFRPKAFILRFPSTAIIMSQTSIKASSSHDLLRCLCRISFCCFASGFLLISVRAPSEMIFLCLSSYRTVLASVHFMKLSRKKSSTSSAAQKVKSRHNNKHGNLSSSSQMWYTQTHHLLNFTVLLPSTHCEITFLAEGGDTTTCTHQSPPRTMRRLPLWTQGDLGKVGEAAALVEALEVSP